MVIGVVGDMRFKVSCNFLHTEWKFCPRTDTSMFSIKSSPSPRHLHVSTKQIKVVCCKSFYNHLCSQVDIVFSFFSQYHQLPTSSRCSSISQMCLQMLHEKLVAKKVPIWMVWISRLFTAISVSHIAKIIGVDYDWHIEFEGSCCWRGM
jgi:hypothetical protein